MAFLVDYSDEPIVEHILQGSKELPPLLRKQYRKIHSLNLQTYEDIATSSQKLAKEFLSATLVSKGQKYKDTVVSFDESPIYGETPPIYKETKTIDNFKTVFQKLVSFTAPENQEIILDDLKKVGLQTVEKYQPTKTERFLSNWLGVKNPVEQRFDDLYDYMLETKEKNQIDGNFLK